MSQEKPHYPVERVKALVSLRHCNMVRKAYREAENLGYEADSKYQLLEELSENDFCYQDKPEGSNYIMDVYIMKRRSLMDDDLIDEIYIKLLIFGGKVNVDLSGSVNVRSFHLARGGRL